MSEETSIPSGGDAALTGEQQAAEPGAQASGQGQSSEPSQVERGESQASSTNGQARSNYNWANQRAIEKAVSKILSSSLDTRVKPLEESLKTLLERLPNPQGQETQKSEIDFNDLPGSINKMVETMLKQREGAYINKTLPQLKNELLSEVSAQASKQEARKYLQSQKDIGADQSKHDEIQEIIVNDDILYNSLAQFPVKVVQQAVERWRASKRNPNAPGKDELSTVTGGMGTAKRGIDTNRVRELTAQASQNLTMEERQKLNAEVEKLVSSMK